MLSLLRVNLFLVQELNSFIVWLLFNATRAIFQFVLFMTRTNIQTIDNVGKNNVLGSGWTSEKEIKPLNGLSTTHADKIYCSCNGLLSKSHADKIYCSFNGLLSPTMLTKFIAHLMDCYQRVMLTKYIAHLMDCYQRVMLTKYIAHLMDCYQRLMLTKSIAHLMDCYQRLMLTKSIAHLMDWCKEHVIPETRFTLCMEKNIFSSS